MYESFIGWSLESSGKGKVETKYLIEYINDETAWDKFSKTENIDLYSKREYYGVKGFDVVSDPATVEEIENFTDANSIDEYHEYLILYFENGETATFRNSHVDLFRI